MVAYEVRVDAVQAGDELAFLPEQRHYRSRLELSSFLHLVKRCTGRDNQGTHAYEVGVSSVENRGRMPSVLER